MISWKEEGFVIYDFRFGGFLIDGCGGIITDGKAMDDLRFMRRWVLVLFRGRLSSLSYYRKFAYNEKGYITKEVTMLENLLKLIEWIKRIWIPVAGFIGAITLIVQFVELWRGNQAIVIWVTASLSLIILILLLVWVGFSKSGNTNKLSLPANYNSHLMHFPKFYKLARIGLLTLALFTIGSIFSLYNKLESSNSKVIVLITNFDGPDPKKYRVTEIIWENLYSALQEYNDVELVLLENATVKSFSEAKNEAGKYDATIVIWGWYSATDELARVTAHFDILKPPKKTPTEFKNQETMRDFRVGELQNFSVQERLSEEMTFLSLTTVGLVRYSLQDWNGAITSFNSALNYTENEEFTKETQYYIELSNAYSAMITPAPGNVVIIVASQNISQGTVIKGDLMSFIQIPSNKYISIIFSKPEDVIGKYAKFPLDQGVILTQAMIIDSIDIPQSGPQWASLIPPGTTAISIPLCRLFTLGGETLYSTTPCPTP